MLYRMNSSPALDNDTVTGKLLDVIDILFYQQGMANSITTSRPMDGQNNELPWYTYPSITYLNQLDFAECEIVEFGCGFSTLFWSSKAKYVTSIERDELWYIEVSEKIKNDNVDLQLHSDRDEYFKQLDSLSKRKYDVIIIDGRDRYLTTKSMVSALRHGGIIIFDNSDWYPSSCSFLRQSGFSQIDFAGFGPINNYTWCTSVFINGNITIPHNDKLKVIGGLDVIKDDDHNEYI